MTNDLKVEIYTDGGCSGNPGIGGYAYVIRLLSNNGPQSFVFSSFKENTTNNHMELKAIVEALDLISRSDLRFCDITVTSDSSYCINAFTKGWIYGWRSKGFMKNGQPMPNRELWVTLDSILKKLRTIDWVWVKGHNGHRFNEICDRFAVKSYQTRKEYREDIEKL